MRIFLSKISILVLCNFAFTSFAENASRDCFKIGSEWHDITLPSGMSNVRWVFGDNKDQTPFMSVTFNIEDSAFQSWARECSVSLNKSGENYQWDKDIENGTGGFIVVAKYKKNNRYCISVERSSQPETKKIVNGKSYYGCPINGEIDY